MMNLAFKFRLYPNKKQREYFKDNFDVCRFMWNKLLEDTMHEYTGVDMYVPSYYHR